MNKMNNTTILDQLIFKGKGVTLQRWLLPVIIVIITVIALIGLNASLDISISFPTGKGDSGISVSEYPEMQVAEQYAADVAERGETLFEIENPDLNFFLRLKEVNAGIE